MPIRLAIIGCGRIAGRHLAQFRAIGAERVVVAGVYDAHKSGAERFSETAASSLGYTPPPVERFRDLKSYDIDGVMVLTPHRYHAEMALEMLRAGKHVYVEKPLGTSRQSGQVEEVIEEAKGRDRRQVLVVTPFEEYPDVREAQRIANSGAIGKISGGTLYKINRGPFSAWYYQKSTAHDGALFDAGIYGISRFTRLFGPAFEVSAKTAVGGRFTHPADGPVVADVEVEAEITLKHLRGIISLTIAAFSGFEPGTSTARFGNDVTIDCQSIDGSEGNIHINGFPNSPLPSASPLLVGTKLQGHISLATARRRADLEIAESGLSWFEPTVRLAAASERQVAFFLKCIAGETSSNLDRTAQIAKTLQRAHESAQLNGKFLSI